MASQGNWIKQKGKPMRRHLKMHHSEISRLPVLANVYSRVNPTVLAALYHELFLFSQMRKQRKKYLSYKMSNCFPDLSQFPATSRWVSEKTISFGTNQVCMQLFILKNVPRDCTIKGTFRVIFRLFASNAL